jgi:hypothetical protein
MFYHSSTKQATDAQLATLQQLGIDISGWISRFKADRLIKENEKKWAALPMTAPQETFLRARDQLGPRITYNRGEAAKLIGLIKEQESGPPGPPHDWPPGPD